LLAKRWKTSAFLLLLDQGLEAIAAEVRRDFAAKLFPVEEQAGRFVIVGMALAHV
jgi:hypothetical protein